MKKIQRWYQVHLCFVLIIVCLCNIFTINMGLPKNWIIFALIFLWLNDGKWAISLKFQYSSRIVERAFLDNLWKRFSIEPRFMMNAQNNSCAYQLKWILSISRDGQKAQQIESIEEICVVFFFSLLSAILLSISSFQLKLMQTGRIYEYTTLFVSFSFSHSFCVAKFLMLRLSIIVCFRHKTSFVWCGRSCRLTRCYCCI